MSSSELPCSLTPSNSGRITIANQKSLFNGKKAQIYKPINLTSSLKASKTISSVKSQGFISSKFPEYKQIFMCDLH